MNTNPTLPAWVPTADRQPTAEDCDKWGDLWLWMPARERSGPQIGALSDLHEATHWQRLEAEWRVPSPPNESSDGTGSRTLPSE